MRSSCYTTIMKLLRSACTLLAGVSLAIAVFTGTALYALNLAGPGLRFQPIAISLSTPNSSYTELAKVYNSAILLVQESVDFLRILLEGSIVWGVVCAVIFAAVAISLGKFTVPDA